MTPCYLKGEMSLELLKHMKHDYVQTRHSIINKERMNKIFNDLSNFSVFRLGREQIILVIFIFTIFLNLNLNNMFIKIIFYTALFSQFIFGSYAIFLILCLFMFFLETDANKNKISSNIYKNLIKNYK
jgi:hypothetical protein